MIYPEETLIVTTFIMRQLARGAQSKTGQSPRV